MINNIKIVFFILILFTIFNCKSNLEISNNIYKLQKNSKNYEFTWKETLRKSADKSISYPLWFKVNLPQNIQKFEIVDESFIFKYSNKQIVVINESYTLNNIKDKADFNYYLINDFKRDSKNVISFLLRCSLSMTLLKQSVLYKGFNQKMLSYKNV